MAENKTQKTRASVDEFLAYRSPTGRRQEDGLALLAMMKDVTGLEPEMWGPSIVGFGEYHYRYESGREGDMPLAGFSPRSRSLSLYIMDGFDGYDELLARLGKHRRGSVLSLRSTSPWTDVDAETLRELVARSYPTHARPHMGHAIALRARLSKRLFGCDAFSWTLRRWSQSPACGIIVNSFTQIGQREQSWKKY